MEKSKETDGIGYILDQVIPDIMGYGYQPSKNLLKPDYDLKRLGIEQSPETERNMNNNVESKNSSLPGQYINGKPKFPSNLYWTNEEHQMYDYLGFVCDCLKQYDRWKAGTYIFIRK